MSLTTTKGGVVSTETLALFLQEIIVEYESYKKNVRRTEPREPVSVPVRAVLLDEELQPISDPFHMVTRDISVGGTGLFHTESLQNQLLQLEFSSPVSGQVLRVVASVEHCTPCGRYFIIGCRFCRELAN